VQVCEPQLSRTVKVYDPSPRPVTVLLVPTTWPEELAHEYETEPLGLETVPAVTEPLLLPQVVLVCEQEPIVIALGSDNVCEQVKVVQLSCTVNVYVPAPRPVTVAVVPTTWFEELTHEYETEPLAFEMVPAVTEPVLPLPPLQLELQDGLLCEQEPIVIVDDGCIVVEQVTEPQLSLTVKL
jgi:hypothetical protein